MILYKAFRYLSVFEISFYSLTYIPMYQFKAKIPLEGRKSGCMMVVFSAKLFGLFYLRVLRQISTSTVTLMANEVSVSFASFSNTVHTLRQRGVSQLLHETFISPLFHLKSSSVNLKNYRIYSILFYGHIHLA